MNEFEEDHRREQAAPEPGDIVYYKIPDGEVAGEVRPAMVIKRYEGTLLCNLIVFMDGTADGYPGYIVWRQKVKRSSEGHDPGCWKLRSIA